MTTTSLDHARNPFLLMLDPQSVISAMESSPRLVQLNSHICRPLDRQMPGSKAGGAASHLDDEIEGDSADAGEPLPSSFGVN